MKMDRKETTKFLGQLLINTRFGGAGKHWASEVSIDPWGREAKRVDYMQFSPADQCSISGIEKGIFTCYEIKSCKEDVYSGNGLNFLGEKNYIVTTMECYKDILPDLRSGKFSKHMREQFPESSNYFGVMVAIPDWAEATDEFEKPHTVRRRGKTVETGGHITVPLWTEKTLHDRIVILHVTERTLRRKNH